MILIQCAPGGCVLFLLLGAHTTCFLVLEFQEQSRALLNCHFLTSKASFLKASAFYSVHGGNIVLSTEQLLIGSLFLILSVVHPENMVFSSCSLYLSVCHTHTSPSQKCREQNLCVGERAEWQCPEPAGEGEGCESRAHERTCGKVGADEVSSVCPSVWNSF